MVALMASVEMDSVLLRLREGDHVGVLKRTLKGGAELVHAESRSPRRPQFRPVIKLH